MRYPFTHDPHPVTGERVSDLVEGQFPRLQAQLGEAVGHAVCAPRPLTMAEERELLVERYLREAEQAIQAARAMLREDEPKIARVHSELMSYQAARGGHCPPWCRDCDCSCHDEARVAHRGGK